MTVFDLPKFADLEEIFGAGAVLLEGLRRMNLTKVLDILRNGNYVVHGFSKEDSSRLHLARDQVSQMLDTASRSRASQF